MAESKNQTGLLAGIILGVAAGAGITFLFGTKRGKDIRNKLRKEYPEAFEKIDEVIEGTQGNLKEGYENASEKAGELQNEVRKLGTGVKDSVVKKVQKHWRKQTGKSTKSGRKA